MSNLLLNNNSLNGINGKIKNLKIVSENAETFSLLELQLDMPTLKLVQTFMIRAM